MTKKKLSSCPLPIIPAKAGICSFLFPDKYFQLLTVNFGLLIINYNSFHALLEEHLFLTQVFWQKHYPQPFCQSKTTTN